MSQKLTFIYAFYNPIPVFLKGDFSYWTETKYEKDECMNMQIYGHV